ncbi:DUF917 domain-containing protein [Vibrio sp. SS-MA-C1-2]|uniref:DUF917 domain-containing protein n=1 Tax=Vibrio sp. SS-MA-C1-2 TaxID=2908646 RepID=UPI001F3084A3|nr:DUF917 domain-containing protein [Vibrio sp. SS-MA-C1-2]UJF17230.1 DUF917 domain-containing protein [Vibrio sp. SS-MA-C1-2]
MTQLILKTEQEVRDLVRGLTFFATGGGGLPKNGIASFMSELDAGRDIILEDIDSIADDAITACPFLMGSISPHSDETKNEMEGFGFTASINNEKARMLKAIEELEEYTGVKIDAIIPIELAGANAPAAIAAAQALGKVAVNGDYTGRAIPEIQQTTPYLADKPITPITSVDEWDNVCLIKKASNYRVAERLGKLISAGAYGLAGQAGFLLSGKEAKELLVRNTMTECYELGKLIRECNEQGKNTIEEILTSTNGYKIFSGTIQVKDDEDRIGYYWGTYTIEGVGQDQGKTSKLWFKNEHHMCWINDEVAVTSPDTIVMVDTLTGEPIPNPLSYVGQDVTILAISSREHFKTQKGIDILGPKYFGFDEEYIPVEHRQG